MTKKTILAVAIAAASVATANAGGMLTNTNQNAAFLRNPARDAAIGIDGVYSNPAGVVFLGDGNHLSLNWQAAWQTREVETTSKLLDHTLQDNDITRKYVGMSIVPFIPSVQFAHNEGKWSIQGNFAINGGGGKCEFNNGLGSFEAAVGKIGSMLKPLGVNGYSCDQYMQGNQYYFGFTVGAAYKVTDNLSVYGGLRALYGTASYKAKISNIMVAGAKTQYLADFLDATTQQFSANQTAIDNARKEISEKQAYINEKTPIVDAALAKLEPVYQQLGENMPAELLAQYKTLVANKAELMAGQVTIDKTIPVVEAQQQTLNGAQASIKELEVYRNGVNLQCDQDGFGISPIIGVDYKCGPLNFAAKYEFRTRMSMKNTSNLKEAMAVEEINQFVDGNSVREDSPALLAVGGQWNFVPKARLNVGYHHFYDKQARKYNNKQELLSGGTNEYLGGVEVDFTENLTFSIGGQITRYGNTDQYISDLSYVVNSGSFGFGASYRVNKDVVLQAAYFKTIYSDYNGQKSIDVSGKAYESKNTYTRTNDVIGISCDITF